MYFVLLASTAGKWKLLRRTLVTRASSSNRVVVEGIWLKVLYPESASFMLSVHLGSKYLLYIRFTSARDHNLIRMMLLRLLFLVCSAQAFVVAPKATNNFRQSLTTVNAKVTTDSGLVYEDLEIGEGDVPGEKDFVSVHYEGKFENGKVFDSSRPDKGKDSRRKSFQGKPIQIALGAGKVIPGLDEGVSTMKVGGKRRLYIPSNLAYGANGAGELVKPNTNLVFDVELVKVDFMMSGQLGSAGSIASAFKIVFGLIAVNGLTSVVTGHELREYIYNAIS